MHSLGIGRGTFHVSNHVQTRFINCKFTISSLFLISLKTGSLDNATQDFLMAQPLWYMSHQYLPTSGLMQILYFDWLRYKGSNSNSHRVAKFAGFSLVFSPKKFFQLAFAIVIIAFFYPTSWVILKQLDPSPSTATNQQPIRPSASWAFGLRV